MYVRPHYSVLTQRYNGVYCFVNVVNKASTGTITSAISN